jgi:hypothetical protein
LEALFLRQVEAEERKTETLVMSVDFNNFLPCLTVEKVIIGQLKVHLLYQNVIGSLSVTPPVIHLHQCTGTVHFLFFLCNCHKLTYR